MNTVIWDGRTIADLLTLEFLASAVGSVLSATAIIIVGFIIGGWVRRRLVSLGGTVIPMLHLAFGIISLADYSAPIWLPVIGAALLLPGLHLFWRSHADLGRNWSVTTEIREDHTLITDGFYARIRHPMYTAIFLICIAQALLMDNWLAGPA